MQDKWSWIDGSHGMRTGILDALTDADLAFNPGGQNMTLGALIREMGEVEHSYIESLKTFKQSWDYRNPEPGIDTSVARLKAWFEALDADLQATASALSDEDLSKTVERPGGYAMPVETQLDVYLQALLIFFGKVTIFFKAMDKPLPPSVGEYIG
ncbi:MAG: DinB family protein [Anaerolineae bacterium]|nr:DinB family protein [Anaerolineae bacterium]